MSNYEGVAHSDVNAVKHAHRIARAVNDGRNSCDGQHSCSVPGRAANAILDLPFHTFCRMHYGRDIAEESLRPPTLSLAFDDA